MKMLVLGAGLMGSAAVIDMLREKDVVKVTAVDNDQGRLDSLREQTDDPRLHTLVADISDDGICNELFAEHDSCLSAVFYWFNERLARLAIANTCHFCDLGGNNSVVDAELAMDEQAKAAGVTVIPDCGLAPGYVAILTADGMKRIPDANEVHIRVGGLPQNPKPPLDYALFFSVHGLINEYAEPVRLLRNGEYETVECLTEVESLTFPAPYETLEAFTTSGGTSTLVETYRSQLRDLDYKTIRYPGHAEKMRTFMELGFFSEEEEDFDGVKVTPRKVLEKRLERALGVDPLDATLVRVTVKNEAGKQVVYQVVDHADPATGHTAMMRNTAYPAAIVAVMMADGSITTKGAVPQEKCVPTEVFIERLRARGVPLSIQ